MYSHVNHAERPSLSYQPFQVNFLYVNSGAMILKNGMLNNNDRENGLFLRLNGLKVHVVHSFN